MAVDGRVGTICYSLVLGARQTARAGKQFTRRDDALIRELTFRHFPDGFTIFNADGGWFDPARGRFIEEEARQILVCARRRRDLQRWCEDLARALAQKELLVVELGPATTFSAARRALRRKRS